MSNKIIYLAILWLATFSTSAQKIRVACIGNSITYGYAIEDREHDSYPAQLQQLLGDAYEVGNFGISSATAQKEGNLPWTSTQQYQDAKAFQPQIAVIKLGTNDSKERNWLNAERLISGLEAIAEEFEALPSHPRIIIALPAKAYQFMFSIRDSIIYNYELPAIRQMAKQHHWRLVDLYKATDKMPDCFPDGIHPNPQGAGVIARKIKKAVLKEKKKL